MLRVVMISTLPPEKTGESVYTLNLIESLAKTANIEITAITGREAHVLPSMQGKVATERIWDGKNITYPITLLKSIVKKRPHLVHIQFGPHGQVYGGLFGEPMLFLLILLRLVGIKTTVTLHSTWLLRQVETRVKTYRKLRLFSAVSRPLFRMYMKLLDIGSNTIQLSTVTLNSTLRKLVIREYGFNPDKILEIPHPCQRVEGKILKHEALQKLAMSGKEVVLLFGFVRRGKGIEVAIKAMKKVVDRVPEAVLVVAGAAIDEEGRKYMQELHALQHSEGLEQSVVFRSAYIEEKDVPVYFSAASIILLPYEDSVGASGPAHSQAGYGIPVLASDAGVHMREMFDGNIALFHSGNSMDLANQIVKLLSDENVASRLGNAICQYSARESTNLMAKRTLKNYERTLRM